MSTYTPGDVVLVRDYSGQGDLLGNLILNGEQSRHGAAFATHCVVIVSEDGGIVEAEQKAVEHNNISKYAAVQTKIVHFSAPADDPRRAFAVRYALAQVGEPYGVIGFISLGVDLATGLTAGLHVDREPICSELAARATESMTDHGWTFAPERMLPDDIGVDMGILPPGKALPIYKRWLLLFRSLYWGLAPWKTGIRPHPAP